MQKAIPAFYGCYLLRSTIRPSSLYVGSTPNPVRRLDQHNGRVKGGAVRTGRVSLRPWEMTCIVGGFASNIAALQFEWAWHNSHLTRHIPQDERISFATTRTKTSSRTGRVRRRPGRPRTSLTEKLSNLHLLLRSPYFSKWPLEVRFFSEDVYRVWQTWCERVDGQVSDHIQVWLDLKAEQPDATATTMEQPPKRRRRDVVGKGGVDGIDATYASLQPVLEKGHFVLEPGEQVNCDVCKRSVALDHDLLVICPHGDCRGMCHIDCLARHFRTEQGTETLVPVGGKCPSCRQAVQWLSLMKELTVRVRGAKQVVKILKKTRAGSIVDMSDEEDELSDDEDVLTRNDIADEGQPDGDDAMSVTSVDSECASITTAKVGPGERLEIVIEDSDDEIEIGNT